MVACDLILSRGIALEHDVIIVGAGVGAGPAGSTTARFCAKKGLKTLLVEKIGSPDISHVGVVFPQGF